jgi:hypothetical protein
VSAEKGMNVSDAFVFCKPFVREDRAFRIRARDRGVQASQLVTTISERDLRKQQNEEDD